MNAVQATTDISSLKRSMAQATETTVGLTTIQGFELAQRAAKLLASSSLVPKQYQGNLPNCVVALNMAQRIGADPLMVMQNLYIVHGTPAWSAQFLIATFNTCGRFSALRYEFTGKEGTDEWGCRAWAIEKATGDKLVGSWVTIGLAKKEGWYQKNGSKWQTMPQQMLMYRAAAWFIRAYAPEIAMGLQTAEELGDVYDAEPDETGSYTVTDIQHGEHMKDAGKATSNEADAWPRQDEEGRWFDSSGEIYDPERHGWSREHNRPSVTADGRFRARRRSRSEAEAQQSTGQAENGNPPPAPEEDPANKDWLDGYDQAAENLPELE